MSTLERFLLNLIVAASERAYDQGHIETRQLAELYADLPDNFWESPPGWTIDCEARSYLYEGVLV